MSQAETTAENDPKSILELIGDFTNHLKTTAGQSKSAANTAQSYEQALQVFKTFIDKGYKKKIQGGIDRPIDILEDNVLLAYYTWLNKTPPITHQPETDETADDKTDEESPPTKPPRYAHTTIQFYMAAVKRFLTWTIAQNELKDFDFNTAQVRLKDASGQGRHAYAHRKIDPNLAAIVLYYDNLPLPSFKVDPKARKKSNLAAWHAKRRRIALLRNRAILHVFYDTGLRVSELTSLTRDEVDRALRLTPLPEDMALEVVGKGGRLRTVWLTRETLACLQDYLDERDDPSNVLFVGKKKGTPLTRQMVWKIVKDGAEAAGVDHFTGPHAFRHWLARQLFNDEEDPVPIEDVQVLLGHASPTTTRMIYAPHSSKSRLHKAIKKARKRPEDTLKED